MPIFKVLPSTLRTVSCLSCPKICLVLLKLELNSPDEAPDASLPKGRSPEERGRKVYQSRCKLCHGAELAGKPPAVPSLTDVGSRLSGDEVRAVVTRGHGPMPAISSLSDAGLDSLVAYLFHPGRTSASAPERSCGKYAGGGTTLDLLRHKSSATEAASALCSRAADCR